MSGPFLSSDWYRVAELKPALRSHGRVVRQRFRGRAWYVLHDPATQRALRLSPTAWMLVSSLDGATSVDAAWHRIVAEVGDDAPSQDEVIRALSSLHSMDLLQADTVPDIEDLATRRDKQHRAKWLKSIVNPLAVRIPLWDPDAFLEHALPAVRPLIGWWGALLWLILVVPAAFLAGQHWSELTENFSDRILAPDNLLLILITFPVVKLFHELAHGFVTKAGGGEVHELGVMFLVFAPAPYVDASAATAFRSKWYRALVGAAGMIIELAVAAIALHAWLLLSPGILRAIAFNVVMVASVATLVFNGNPLLRFDGYYILCDLLEIPNLGQRANQYYGWLFRRYAFGEKELPPPEAGRIERIWFLLYAPFSLVYRTLVGVSIALFIAGRYSFVGIALAVWCAISMFVIPPWRLLQTSLARSRASPHRRRTWMTVAGGAGLLTAFALFLPLPLSTVSEGVIWVPEFAEIRSAGQGFVSTLLTAPNEPVEAGTPIFRLEDPALETSYAAQRSRVERLEILLASQMKDARSQAALTLDELNKERAAVADLEERRAELVTTSRATGTFTLAKAEDFPNRFIRRGDLVGYVAIPELNTVRVVVAQDDVGLVRAGTHGVAIRLVDRPLESFSARIVREVPSATQELPSQALTTMGGGQLPPDPKDPQGLTALERVFQFDLELEQGAPDARIGTRAYIRFEHEPEPMAYQALRRLRQLFLATLHV